MKSKSFYISKDSVVGRSMHYMSVIFFVLTVLAAGGCNGPGASGPKQVKEFEKAGEKQLTDKTTVEATRGAAAESYIVSVGDVLEIQMPVILKDVIAMPHENEPYLCRVNDSGNIPLPIVGEINVVNQTLAKAEETIAKTYYPEYVVTMPAVVCKVREHIDMRQFTITGLVMKAGVFPYPTNAQYNLIDAIAAAGGVDFIADPHYAKVYRKDSSGKVVSAIFKIDKSATDKALKVIIKPGDIVSVEPTLQTQTNLFFSQVFRVNVGAYINPNGF
jgi:protein involved in polysaccharide export with SLBB domain